MDFKKIDNIKKELDSLGCSKYSLSINFESKGEININYSKPKEDQKIGF